MLFCAIYLTELDIYILDFVARYGDKKFPFWQQAPFASIPREQLNLYKVLYG